MMLLIPLVGITVLAVIASMIMRHPIFLVIAGAGGAGLLFTT